MKLKTKISNKQSNGTDLNQLISLDRRYSRSIHLERDIHNPDALKGYVVTPRAKDVITRFIDSFVPGSSRAWTITGVYGTGKSSVAHFLTALAAPQNSSVFTESLRILKHLLPQEDYSHYSKNLKKHILETGLIRAIATARREPIHHTIARALLFGLETYTESVKTSKDIQKLKSTIQEHLKQIESGIEFSSSLILDWIQDIQQVSGNGILLIIDELGKSFEYAAQYPHRSDLYLLQELAEYPALNSNQGLFVFGLLHQAFSEYARNISGLQFNEWAKVQGRFEDIAFAESQDQILRLMGQSILHEDSMNKPLIDWAQKWLNVLSNWTETTKSLNADVLAKVYPLHPIAALALPQLCQRYAQNERSLFTFMGSQEPFALSSFLNQPWNEKKPSSIKLTQIYDYFVESANLSISSHTLSQRWLEIQNRLADARHLDQDLQDLLKTIAVLNLVSLGGDFRARRSLIINAMLDLACNSQEDDYQAWDQRIDHLVAQNFVNWWERFDELRIWQGSNFDLDGAVQSTLTQQQFSIFEIFTQYCALQPLVAQRHSYTTGTLRYFARLYFHPAMDLEQIKYPNTEADGFIYYSLVKSLSDELPEKTADGRPIIYLQHPEIESLTRLGQEYAALHKVSLTAAELKTDTVARREVDHRLAHSKRILLEQLSNLFHVGDSEVKLWLNGNHHHIKNEAALRQLLSKLCDDIYCKSPVLWNELINRREVTSQGAKARRDLIGLMLSNQGIEKLGIEGYGPERSIFESLLHHTGLYSQTSAGEWAFQAPSLDSSLYAVWQFMHQFCWEATEKTRSIDELFKDLQQTPFGLKFGPLPILLAAFLICYQDEISLFQDGTFIPLLSMEQFELLIRHPQRFAVKCFAIEGLQSEYFRELQEVLVGGKTKSAKQAVRNQSILSLVTPLIRFIKRQPEFTHKTARVSDVTKKLRRVLLETQDPGQLILVDLPQALGFAPILGSNSLTHESLAQLKQTLIKALGELQKTYPEMLLECQTALEDALGKSDKISFKDSLSQRAMLLKDAVSEPVLTRFIHAAADSNKQDTPWLESLVMVIADKPPQHWADQHFEHFKYELTQLKQRFLNFEALQVGLDRKHSSAHAKRIVVTSSDGYETQKIVWLEKNEQEQADKLIQTFIAVNQLEREPRLKELLLVALAEKLSQE